jgi:predicted transposase YbfD/YdcC
LEEVLSSPQEVAQKFSATLAGVTDHRRIDRGNLQYSLQEIFFLTITAVVCGCDSWEGIDVFGKTKLAWFRLYFPYQKRTPSADTLIKFFAKLDTASFGQCFISWANERFKNMSNEVISIDGKRLCGSYDIFRQQAAIHVVSAYASANQLALGQVITQQKSNEITAIPELLNLIEVKDTTVSIDAMGCQKEIAATIREKQAHYLLAVKENQKELHQNIVQSFERQPADDSNTNLSTGHGRVEKRTCDIITSLDWVEAKPLWKDLNTLVRITSERTQKLTGETQRQIRYYISSKKADALTFNGAVRSHWAIENKLHWVMDVTFREDHSRKRLGNSAFNFNIITKMALKILEKNKGNLSKPITRNMAAWDDVFRDSLIKNL